MLYPTELRGPLHHSSWIEDTRSARNPGNRRALGPQACPAGAPDGPAAAVRAICTAARSRYAAGRGEALPKVACWRVSVMPAAWEQAGTVATAILRALAVDPAADAHLAGPVIQPFGIERGPRRC